MTYIKLCGMTREEDVTAAVDLGADAIGFVLWPHSPRSVGQSRLASLVRLLPAHVTPVAVFVKPGADEIAAAIESGARVVQVHGTSDVPQAACDIWMAATLADGGIMPDVDEEITVVLDAHDPERHGGTGRTIDWQRAAGVARTRRTLLAGGLTPANVADAIKQVRPFGVDVASGIEERPGVKNAAAMRAFVAAVREADR